MRDLSILAKRISDWISKKPDLDVLTFDSIDAGNIISSSI